MAFTYLKVKSAKCLFFRWSWSCYFGLGLKNSVLFTSLPQGSYSTYQVFSKTFHDPVRRVEVLVL